MSVHKRILQDEQRLLDRRALRLRADLRLAGAQGVTFDPKSGLYHRFYQYDKTYGDACMHGNTRNCSLGPSGAKVPNAQARTWGQTVSRDGAFWEDWPGVDADKAGVDDVGVFSGNCAIDDDGSPVCIYSNGRCDIGVCAYSTDWVHWSKTACMTKAPSARSQTNHDSSIWRCLNTLRVASLSPVLRRCFTKSSCVRRASRDLSQHKPDHPDAVAAHKKWSTTPSGTPSATPPTTRRRQD